MKIGMEIKTAMTGTRGKDVSCTNTRSQGLVFFNGVAWRLEEFGNL